MTSQIIQPNYAINEVAGLCLSYARKTFGLPAVEPTAYEAFRKLKYFHADRNFPVGSVPVWFEWYGDLGNGSGRLRYDHVAVRDASGTVWSSPLIGKGRVAFSSVDALVRAFGGGMKYLGWSEDISGTRVVNVGGNMKITTEQVVALSIATTGKQPSNADEKKWIGQELTQASLDDMITFYASRSRIRSLEDDVSDLSNKAPVNVSDAQSKLDQIKEIVKE